MLIDGDIDVSGTKGMNTGSAGGSGGSILLEAKTLKGKGRLIANGGMGSDTVAGGGGGGGRIALHSASYNFTGKYTAYGGLSNSETGGAGTVYVKHGNETSLMTTHLYIDNRNQQPKTLYLSTPENTKVNTGKTWLMMEKMSEISLSKLTLKGRAHVAVHRGNEADIKISTKVFEGDFSGYLHVSKKINMTVIASNVYFPVSFRVYLEGHISLPEKVVLDSFANKDVLIYGSIAGVRDLTVSSGVRVLFGNKVSKYCVLRSKLLYSGSFLHFMPGDQAA